MEHPQILIEKIYAAVKNYCVISTPNGAYKRPKEYDYNLWTPNEFSKLFANYDFEYHLVDKSKMYLKLIK